jgi:hypothetical protein
MANEWKRLGLIKFKANGRAYWKGIKLIEAGESQPEEEIEENILIYKPSTPSTPSTVSSTFFDDMQIHDLEKR